MPQTGCKRITLRSTFVAGPRRGDKRETWSNENKLPLKSLECETPRRREDVWVFGSRLPEVDTSQMSGSQADLATPSVGFQWLPPGCSNLRGKLEWPAGLTQIVTTVGRKPAGKPRLTASLHRDGAAHHANDAVFRWGDLEVCATHRMLRLPRAPLAQCPNLRARTAWCRPQVVNHAGLAAPRALLE